MSGIHAKRAASKAKQRRACPGSLPYTDTLPDRREGSTTYAKMGTCAHAVLERCLEKDLKPEEFLGRIIVILFDDEGYEKGTSILPYSAKVPKDPKAVWYEFDQDLVTAVNVAVDYVKMRLEELGPGTEMRLEQKLTVLVERDDSFGTGDVVLDAWPDVLEVADYKNGSGVVVEVTDNDQTRSYLLGAARETGFSHDLYRHTIIQPNGVHRDGPVRSQKLTREELLTFEEELMGIESTVDRATEELDQIVSGEQPMPENVFEEWVQTWLHPGEHCKSTFCDARWDCPALRAKVAEEAGVDFADAPTHLVEITSGDLKRLGQARKWAPIIKDWVKQIEEATKRELEAAADQSVSEALGFKLVAGKSNREWISTITDDEGEQVKVDNEWLATTLIEDFKVPEAKVWIKPAPKILSGPQAEKLVPKDLKKDFNRMMLYKPPGSPTVVPIDDPGEPINRSKEAAADFADEEDGS